MEKREKTKTEKRGNTSARVHQVMRAKVEGFSGVINTPGTHETNLNDSGNLTLTYLLCTYI